MGFASIYANSIVLSTCFANAQTTARVVTCRAVETILTSVTLAVRSCTGPVFSNFFILAVFRTIQVTKLAVTIVLTITAFARRYVAYIKAIIWTTHITRIHKIPTLTCFALCITITCNTVFRHHTTSVS